MQSVPVNLVICKNKSNSIIYKRFHSINTMRFSLFTALIFLVLHQSTIAQTTVTPVTDANELAQSLLGSNSGIVITNPTLNCPGAQNPSGIFETVGPVTSYGIQKGVLLTSGTIDNIFQSNTGNTSVGNNGLGDPDLNTLTTNTTTDVCILEFDMYIPGDTVKFDYVFASEEYNDYVNSSFNDVFGFFISGPGITGNENIALIPGTSTSITINNVNCGLNPQYYLCNDANSNTQGGCNPALCPTDNLNTTVQHDGFTTVLTALKAVQPCNTYHLKIAVGDVGDTALDSGVFLEAGSLVSNSVQIELNSLYTDPTGNPAAVEGCNFNPEFILNIESSAGGGAQDSACFTLETSGTAIEGVDYEILADTICFAPGDTQLIITIIPIVDNIAEPVETIIITVTPLVEDTATGCGVNSVQAQINLYDFPIISAGPDITICQGETTQLNVSPAPNYSWSPPINLSCTTCPDPVASPTVTTVYTVTSAIGSCSAQDQVTVFVDNPLPVEAMPDDSICPGGSITLSASNSSGFTWGPASSLSCTDCANPVATPNVTTTYTVIGNNACFTSQDEVVITVNPLPVITISNPQNICPGSSVTINASAANAETYAWSPSAGLSSSTVSNPTASPTQNTTYSVTITNENGCSDTASVSISIYTPVSINAAPDESIIYWGEGVQLTTETGSSFQWLPTFGLDNPNIGNPYASPTETTTYYVTALDVNGCQVTDSLIVIVNKDAFVNLPSAFSPNKDGKNDFFRVIYKGIFNMDEFAIYNRWGQKIWFTNNVNEGWDGTINGEPAPVGTYVFMLTGNDLDNNAILKQGNVTVVR